MAFKQDIVINLAERCAVIDIDSIHLYSVVLEVLCEISSPLQTKRSEFDILVFSVGL